MDIQYNRTKTFLIFVSLYIQPCKVVPTKLIKKSGFGFKEQDRTCYCTCIYKPLDMFQPLEVKHTRSLSSLICKASMSHTHVNNPASSTLLLQPSPFLFSPSSSSSPSHSPLPLLLYQRMLPPCGDGHDLHIEIKWHVSKILI